MELLHELLLHAGDVVTKDELLNAVWPGISVVEASLPTAIAKLRRAIGDDDRDLPIIETVPRIGYRLAMPVKVEDPPALLDQPLPPAETVWLDTAHTRSRRWPMVAGASAAIFAAAALVAAQAMRAPAPVPAVAMVFTQVDAADAVRELDVPKLKAMLRAGWKADTPFDDQGNTALNMVANICEWDRARDPQRMVLFARTLLEGGARVDHVNVWGDTPYSIAKAERYCGADHPLAQMLRAYCSSGGSKSPKEACLATYERRRH